MDDPNCHTDSEISIHSAAIGSPNQRTRSRPKKFSSRLTIPVVAEHVAPHDGDGDAAADDRGQVIDRPV